MSFIKKLIKQFVDIFVKPLIFFFYNNVKRDNVHKLIKGKRNSFFGYYNKCPWNKSQTKILSLNVENSHKEPDSDSTATIILTDVVSGVEEKIYTTHCWNTQQGCMAQWLGPDFETKIIFNDFEGENFVSKIYDIRKKCIIKVLKMPVYDVSSDGTFALSLDFTRLHVARPGYGYKNKKCETKNVLCPNDFCIWKINLETGKIIPLIKYSDLYNFDYKESMAKAFHKVNHIVINPSGSRFMFLHRWINENKKITRLITCDIDGKNMYNLSDDDMVSHCSWKDDRDILGFLRKKEYGDHYYILKDKSQDYRMIWKNISDDGHCTYDIDKKRIVSDTYPNVFGISKVYVGTEEDVNPDVVASFFSPSVFKGDLRCDLHPRWSPDGEKISVDSVGDGYKKIYIIDIKK